MPAPALLLLLAALLPLFAFGLLFALGRRMGNPLAGWAATAFATLSFGASLWAMVIWCSPGGRHYHGVGWGMREQPITLSVPWLPTGPGIAQDHPGFADVGLYIDSLTLSMFAMITLVAAIVSAFSIGYLRPDADYSRFFLLLSLLCFSVLALTLSSSLLQVLVFWGLGGVCAYLLVNFWHGSPAPSAAALKSFLILGAGDGLLLIGICLLISHVGNLGFAKLWATLGAAGAGKPAALGGGASLPTSLLTAIGVCLVLGAGARAAQFPLHAWWGEFTEAPAPASALLHAGAFSISGIYLLARLFPILTPDVKLLLAILGAATALVAALIAVAHPDLKRVIAYSLLAQLGLMAVGLGTGSWGGALFHLVTCGFIGTLLMLACGSVVRAAGGRRALARFGGLWVRIPVTAAAFAVGGLALAGMPGFSGYFSRRVLLTDVAAYCTMATQFGGRSIAYWAFFAAPILCGYLIAFALTRCWMLTFWGRPRDTRRYARAAESPALWTPLLMLAVLSIFAGSVLGVSDLLRAAVIESTVEARTLSLQTPGGSEPAFGAFDQAWPIRTPQRANQPDGEDLAEAADEFTPAIYAHDHGAALEHQWGRWSWVAGLLAGSIVYCRGYAVSSRLLRVPPLRWGCAWLADEMSFSSMYEWVFGRTVVALAEFAGAFERFVVEGVSNLLVWSARRVARGRRPGDRRMAGGVARMAQRALVRSP